MKRIFRSLFISIVCFAAVSASALDLPVKSVNGKPYYYYVVKKGDTVYSLTSRLGITRKQLVESNPSAADILKTGDTLYFAVDKFGDGKSVEIESDDNVAQKPADIIIHKVKKGETLYGISRQYKVDTEAIVALNPSARLGVKTGATLRIPVAPKAEAEDPQSETQTVEEEPVRTVPDLSPTTTVQPVRETPVLISETPVESSDDDLNETEDVVMVEEAVAVNPDSVFVRRQASIAVLLPFMLEAETPGRQAELFTDFYKGLLIAADTLSNRGDSLKIYAFDTMGDMARLKKLLEDDAVKNASVIIAPDNGQQLAAIADAVRGSDTKVINVFNVKDSLFMNHQEVIQTNTPHTVMYAKAVDAMQSIYPDCTPVVIRNKSGRTDKAEFIDYMLGVYRSKGVEPVEIEYDGALVASQLETLPNDGTKYVIVPSSGSLSEFNKFIHAIVTVKASRDIALFGYPDWTAFRNDAESLLHAADATVFSRFYYDANSFDTRSLNQAFMRWYGSEMMEVVPNQGVLGYDIGNLLIRNLRVNDGLFNAADGNYTGVQSSFDFGCASDRGDRGFYNNEIYILRFTPGRRVERQSF